jgi:hypothetical protein
MADPDVKLGEMEDYRGRANSFVHYRGCSLLLRGVDVPGLIPVMGLLRVLLYSPQQEIASISPGHFQTLDLEICH